MPPRSRRSGATTTVATATTGGGGGDSLSTPPPPRRGGAGESGAGADNADRDATPPFEPAVSSGGLPMTRSRVQARCAAVTHAELDK